MAEVRLRPKGQITIPASILAQAKLVEDARLEVSLVNGVITLTPKPKLNQREDILGFAGIFKGAWGQSPEQVEDSLNQLRDEWER